MNPAIRRGRLRAACARASAAAPSDGQFTDAATPDAAVAQLPRIAVETLGAAEKIMPGLTPP